MDQDIKKIELTLSQWADIVDFLSNNIKQIHSLLSQVMHDRDMIESRIILSHFRYGTPQLSLEIEYPQDQDQLIVALMQPSKLISDEKSIRKDYCFNKLILFVSNQIMLSFKGDEGQID